MFWWVLTVLVLALCAYLVIRPTLRAMPRLKTFYDDADTFREKLWALCYKSATNALSYALMALGFVMDRIDMLATVLGDPQFKEQLSAAIGADTKVLGWVLMVISVLIFASRMRSIVRG